jgi:MarR family transcriptional regulator, organic hydroperoxide resistance regulator
LLEGLLTASKPELLEGGSDRALRAVLHDYFAFARNLEESRTKFANYVGLSPTQYMILIAVAHAPQSEPVGISQIADKLHLSGAFVTIEVNKLVAGGLVDKGEHPSDGRRVQLFVTDEGVDRLTRLAAFQRPVNDALFGMLSREEFRLLSVLLTKLAANGDNAVKLASHLEASMELARLQNPEAKAGMTRSRKHGARRRARQV